MKGKKNTTIPKATDGDDQKRINILIQDRVNRVRDIIRDTTLSVQSYKKHNIFSNSEVNICVSSLKELYDKTVEIIDKLTSATIESIIDSLQSVMDRLSTIVSTFGTKHMDDLLYVSLGSSILEAEYEQNLSAKFNLIRTYIHPTGCKLIANHTCNTVRDSLCISKITDNTINIEHAPLFECFEYENSTTSFHYKVYGIRVVMRCNITNKAILINGIVDDVNLNLFTGNAYINQRKQDLMKTRHACDASILTQQVATMTLKDILIYGDSDIIKRNQAIIFQANTTKTDKLDTTLKRFTAMDVFSQRSTLIDLLMCVDDHELKYITYLLYDLITNTINEGGDSRDQMLIYDSFPWNIKILFKDAMKHTMRYTHQMAQTCEGSRISLEQQVFTMRAPEQVKDKAMNKLKEIKGKSEESGGKARQYLEGLLRIPFGINREEPILRMLKGINEDFKQLTLGNDEIMKKDKYTNAEIYMYIRKLDEGILASVSTIETKLGIASKISIVNVMKYINGHSIEKIKWSNFKTKDAQIETIMKYVNSVSLSNKVEILNLLDANSSPILNMHMDIERIRGKLEAFETAFSEIDTVFDKSIYGHKHAKQQMKKIIGQWITGKQTGAAFGFEGSPGLGKTSFAKHGLANCLIDEDGTSRPFKFIAVGGSCNGSTFEGHGYTFVNSIWGIIADSVMEAGCMNLIVYIDEVDKISKSEHGNEITGILTHLIDSTQNDCFNDKYFNVPLDLSKVLFIFSYNDPALIDNILLDRIHRIKFDNLSIDEKVVIVRDYIIPDINKKMGMNDIVSISDEMIRHVILYYTMEPGVRKLKELIFDMYGEINLDFLHKTDTEMTLPLILTAELIEDKYLKQYDKIKEHMVHPLPIVGTINGLFANTRGRGGVLPIEVSLFPSATFLDLKLTGLQGDVMKESMNVAKTLAWSLCSDDVKSKLLKQFENTMCQGIHIHCPEGSVNKDGPSAGTAETTAIYSVLNDRPINNTVAITGEIDLRGNITAIGGLEYKISGGIRAGVKTFLFPSENSKDFADFKKKTIIPDDIKFIEVSNIHEVFEHVFV